MIHAHPDPNVAAHCAAVVQEAHENNSEERGERIIVCSTLFENRHADEGGHYLRLFGSFSWTQKRNARIDLIGSASGHLCVAKL